jgi:hypothetical protein
MVRRALGCVTAGWLLGCAGLAELPELAIEPASSEADAEADAEVADAPTVDSAAEEPGIDASDISMRALALAVSLEEAEREPPEGQEPVAVVDSERQERVDVLAAWVTEHPEALEHGELLADRLRALPEESTEEAWPALMEELESKPPLEVSVATAPWRVVVPVARHWHTPPRFEASVEMLDKALHGQGVGTGRFGLGHSQVAVTRMGRPVTTLEVPEQALEPFARGFVVVVEGSDPVFVEEGEPEKVRLSVSKALQRELPAP